MERVSRWPKEGGACSFRMGLSLSKIEVRNAQEIERAIDAIHRRPG
jgi:hypothetical protein